MKELLVIMLIFTAGTGAVAQTGEPASVAGDKPVKGDDPSPGGLVPGMIAIIPGVLVHGSGHYAAGDPGTAGDLLILEGASLGVFLASAVYYAYTGASRRVSPFMVPILTTSSSIFMLTWLADIYGAGFGMGRPGEQGVAGGGTAFAPFLGFTAIDDPQFDYSRFMHFGANARKNMVSMAFAAWHSPDTDNSRYVGEARFDLVGPDGPLGTGYGELVTAGPVLRCGYHDFGDYGFRKTWIDGALAARLYPGHVRESLRGSFVFFEWGWNRERVTFPDIEGSPVLTAGQFLFTAGFGIQLGRLAKPSGTVEMFYNHRRDDFTGGMRGGFTGYVGTSLELVFGDLVGIGIDFSYGAASVLSFRCSYRVW